MVGGETKRCRARCGAAIQPLFQPLERVLPLQPSIAAPRFVVLEDNAALCEGQGATTSFLAWWRSNNGIACFVVEWQMGFKESCHLILDLQTWYVESIQGARQRFPRQDGSLGEGYRQSESSDGPAYAVRSCLCRLDTCGGCRLGSTGRCYYQEWDEWRTMCLTRC